MSESTRGRRKSLIGTVVSTKMDKTAVVSVERRYPHPLYHKIVRSTKRYKAHDADNSAVLGDVVRIVETRPLSKEKRWRIAETLTRGNVADVAPRDIGAPEEAPIETPVVATAPVVVTAAVSAAVAAEVTEAPAAEETAAEERVAEAGAASTEETTGGEEKSE